MASEDLKQRLRMLERLFRPRSTAQRVHAHELARLSDTMASVVTELATVSESLRQVGDQLAHLASEAAAAAAGAAAPEPGIASRNSSDDALTFEVIGRVLGRNDNAIDVGANEGLVLERILEVAPEGTHAAFEPIPNLAERLRSRFEGVEIHEVALSDEEGEATFHHVVTNPSYSGLLRRRYDRPNEEVELTTVRTARLDDVLPRARPISFVKIDVEGAELGVLKGAIETLKIHRPVVAFEHGLGAADFYRTRPEAVWDVLAGCGLDIWLLRSWLDGERPLTLADFVDEFESNRTWFFLAAPPA